MAEPVPTDTPPVLRCEGLIKEFGTDPSVRVLHEGREYRGQAVSTDVIEASARALLEAINRISSVNAARERQAQLAATGS